MKMKRFVLHLYGSITKIINKSVIIDLINDFQIIKGRV